MAEAGRCPLCGRPRSAEFRPFCSRRCADVDLARWLRGDYAAPAEDQAPPGGEADEAEDEAR